MSVHKWPRSSLVRDREICTAIGPTLKEQGLLFVGIDIIEIPHRDQCDLTNWNTRA